MLEPCTKRVVSAERLLDVTATSWANSDVLPAASVAVAEIRVPDATAGSGTVNEPDAFGVAVPRKTAPSP